MFDRKTNELLGELLRVAKCNEETVEHLLRLAEHNERNSQRIIHYLRLISGEVAPPILTSIKIQFSKGTFMPTNPVVGPITLTAVGQSATASVVGFDQFGQPFLGTIPTPTFSASDTTGAIATFDPATGLVVAVANGVDNISASVVTTGPDGNPLTLTDSESVTVAIPVVVPVLSSIKVAFSQ